MTNNIFYEQQWIIPEKFKQPEWVEKDLEAFFDEAKKALGKPNENDQIKKLLEKYILNNKVKPDYPLTKKNIGKLVEKMWEKYPENEFIYRYWMLMRAGFFLSTFKPSGFSPESLKLPKEFQDKKIKLLQEYEKKVKEIGKDKAILWIDKEFNKLTDEVIKYWEKNGVNIVDLIKSKAKGSPSDIRKLLVAVGLSITSAGTINDVIMHSQIEGLEQTEFFHYSSQAIQALYAKSSETAVPGYLARKLSTIAEPVVLSEINDCKSNKYLEVEILDQDILEALDGRMMNTGELIDKDNTKLIGKKVKIRSPLFCRARDGICTVCYNPKIVKKLGFKPGERIGLIATTQLGDAALVNLTLKKSHTGLSLNLEHVDLNKDIFRYAE